MNKLKTKTIPAIIMLSGGLVTSIVTYINHYPSKTALLAILISLIVFLILGEIVKAILDRFELPDENAVDEDGEVIEKSAEDAEENGDESVTEKADTDENQDETPE